MRVKGISSDGGGESREADLFSAFANQRYQSRTTETKTMGPIADDVEGARGGTRVPFSRRCPVRASRYLPVSPIMIYLNRYAYDISAIREAGGMRGQSFSAPVTRTRKQNSLPTTVSYLFCFSMTSRRRFGRPRIASRPLRLSDNPAVVVATRRRDADATSIADWSTTRG